MDIKDFEQIDENYNKNRLVLLPRDSTCLYAYWEISNERKRMAAQHFRCEWGVLPKILRVYDVNCILFNGDNANDFWDIRIHDTANNWFIKDAAPGSSFCIDYGTTTIDGRFFTILRSNALKLPAKDEQSRSEPRIQTIQVVQPDSEPHWMKSFTGYSLHTNEKHHE